MRAIANPNIVKMSRQKKGKKGKNVKAHFRLQQGATDFFQPSYRNGWVGTARGIQTLFTVRAIAKAKIQQIADAKTHSQNLPKDFCIGVSEGKMSKLILDCNKGRQMFSNPPIGTVGLYQS